jgi:hypothetical protein
MPGCEWVGEWEEVEINRDSDPYDPQTNFTEQCPVCGELVIEIEEE